MSSDNPVGKAKISLRIPWFQYGIEERRREVLNWLETYPGTIDEVILFTGIGMFPPDLRIIEHQVADLKKVMPMFRAFGLPAGIDQHTTLGCHYEKNGQTLNQPWQKMVGLEGTVCTFYCASDPRMQDYIRRLYILLAESGPDFIWMDDDIRLTGVQPSKYGCFCDLCLERFAKKTDRQWTRENLRTAFNLGSIEERLSARKAWLAHNRSYFEELYALIRIAVDTVSPSIILGCMNGERPYDGLGYEEIASALSGVRNLPVKWRPGAGFYTDMLPSHLLAKGHAIGRIAAFLPSIVTDIQSECESFPSQSRQKSATMQGLEIGVDIAAGCTGSALNFLPGTKDSITEHSHKFALVYTQRRFYDRLAGTFGRSPCEGIWSARTRDYFACEFAEDDWLEGNPRTDTEIIHEPSELGLPIAYGPQGASVVILHDDICLGFSRDELLVILSGGVCLDGRVLTRLNEMGFAEYTGFTVRTTISEKTCEPFYEVFTSDLINGEYTGWQRDMWGGYWPHDPIYLIEPTSVHSRVLSEVADSDIEGNLVSTAKVLGAGSGVFENSMGGRVAVMGCHPWSGPSLLFNMSLSQAKSSQLKALMRWLSKETLPAYVDSYQGKIGLWCRRDSQKRTAVFLVNVSLDPAENLHIMVRDTAPKLTLFRVDGSTKESLARLKQDSVYSQFVIHHLMPWEMVLLASE